MWQILLLAAIGAGTGYIAGYMQKKRETIHGFLSNEEEAKPCSSNTPFNADMKKAANVADKFQKSQGDLLLSYGVGIGVMFMISTGKQEIDKLSLQLSQTAGLVQELKRQFDAKNDYLQNDETHNSVCQAEILASQEQKLRKAANFCGNKGSGFVETPFEENVSTRSVITDASVHQSKEMTELEEAFQAELEYMQLNFFQSNSSKHERNILGLNESSSVAMVEGGLFDNSLPGQCGSSGDKTPMVQLDVPHMDDYGVSPYELDRHLRDLLEKQQEEKISELEIELKSMEAKLCAKEIELQRWKNHLRCLADHSYEAPSGGDSPTLERASNVDSRRQYLMHALSNGSFKSIVSSAQHGNSQLPWRSLSHCIESPLESTADSPGQLDNKDKMASNFAGLTSLGYGEGLEPTRLVPDFKDCLDFVNAIGDVGSSTCQCEGDGNFTESTDQRFLEMFDKPYETRNGCALLDQTCHKTNKVS